MRNELLDFYRSRGNVPDRIYYQINGKSVAENYLEQRKIIAEKMQQQLEQEQIEKVIADSVNKALDNIFNGKDIDIKVNV